MVNALQFNMSVPTPYVFKAAQSNEKVSTRAVGLMEVYHLN